ncbi:efflux transporter outer membrane subunit [Pseudoduganella danionis]|uniref:efflux transporter outer membrane subunit n=1 Tax=Pseudoduganella danionis TaxID=1890295 RepID=UPI0035B1B384
MQPTLVLCLCLSTLTACSLTPPRPATTVQLPASYRQVPPTSDNAAELGWREVLTEPQLQQLVALGLEHNRDLRVATLNVAAMRAQFQQQDAALLPSVDLNLAASRQRLGAGTPVQPQYSAGIASTAFELDLFGRLRSLSAAAQARFLASDQGRRAAQLSLINAIAEAYLEHQRARAQQQLGERMLADWRSTLHITEQQHQARQRSGMDLSAVQAQVASAEADLQARNRELQLASNALQFLIGTELPAPAALADPLTVAPVRTVLPAGLPSDLLIRRPDIMQAEQELQGAQADIGAARAAFFPRIALTTSFGLGSSEFGDLFKGASRSWSFAPQITQPLFHGGQLQAELSLARIRSSVAVAQYEKAIQNAFREVGDALAGCQTIAPQMAAQQRVLGASRQRAQWAVLRYRQGLDGRLELLDAQRQAYAAEAALIDLQREQYRYALALYKALGGGVS